MNPAGYNTNADRYQQGHGDHQDNRKAILIFVAFHPELTELSRLQQCLSQLGEEIGYAVVVNDHTPGEPVQCLADGADLFLVNSGNPGYGRAVNQAVNALVKRNCLPRYLGALNTDLEWAPGSFETVFHWMDSHPDVVMAVPQLLDSYGQVQQLCKQHPTLMGLLSRRFIPERFKPGWLRRYDNWYVMAAQEYSDVFDVPYLSGCCMLMESRAFCRVGGFDERYFLYLEDADLTRVLAAEGRAVHFPYVSITHNWGRGNHHSKKLTLVNFHSAWLYFSKWGLKFI